MFVPLGLLCILSMSCDTLIRWAIIGCGDVCRVKSGPAFTSDISSLKVIMRRSPKEAQEMAEHLETDFTVDKDEAMNPDRVNAVYIATPPSSHVDMSLDALARGHHVYVEKPLASNLADGIRLVDAVMHNNKSKVVVAHYRRALPSFLRVKELIDRGKIGKVRSAHISTHLGSPDDKLPDSSLCDWHLNPSISGGGRFHDLSPHQLDFLMWMFGRPVSCSGTSIKQVYTDPRAGDDTTSGIMVLKEDNTQQQVVVTGSWMFGVDASVEHETCSIFGDEGNISFNFFGLETVIRMEAHGEVTTEAYTHPRVVQQPFIEQVNRFFRGEEGVTNPCDVEDGLAVLRCIEIMAGKEPAF